MLSVGVKALLVLGVLFISACDPQKSAVQIQRECYQQGYAQGVIDGGKKGYDRGYAEGYEQVYPGSKHQHSGFLAGVQKLFVALGALKIIISLAFFILYLLGRTQSEDQLAGKILMGVLGCILVMWSASAFSMSDTLMDFLLSPSSETVLGWLFFGCVSASLTYTVFRFVNAFVRTFQGARLDAWCILFASALITIFVPTLIAFKDVPDINKYFASELLVGVLIGGLYYLADRLLLSKPEKSGTE